MEERKLNFNAPLLSARRFSAPTSAPNGVKGNKTEKAQFSRRHTMPSYASDSNLEQVTEPVAVPFHWEKIPGRRKDGRDPEYKTLKEACFSPRIPPRKVSDVIMFPEEEKFNDVSVLKKRAEVDSFRESVSELERLKESKAQTSGLDLENDNVDDDDEDAFSDALDTLSPTDSCSMNCSVTGLSSYDGQLKKLSGTFSTDAQTRDFMMSRFLPAAKAMALEPNHYAPKKQPVAVEQHKPIPKVVSRDRTPPVSRYESAIVLYGAQNPEEEESEEDYDIYETSGNIRTKACGLIPRLCFRNSLAILNPIPGMKAKTQTSKPSTRDMGKPSKTSYSRSQSPMVKKHLKGSVNKKKPDTEVQSPRLSETKSKLTCGSNRFASDRQTVSRSSSPFRRSGAISPYRNEARQSPFRSTTFLGISKEAENANASRPGLNKKFISRSQELVSYRGSSTMRGSGPLSFAAEKTLYVDTVNRAQKLCSGSGFSNMKHRLGDSARDVKTLLKSRELEGTAARESFSEEVKCLNVPSGYDELVDKGLRSNDVVLSSLSDKKTLGSQVTTKEDPGQESKALVCISDAIIGNQNTSSDLIRKEDGRGNSGILSAEAPLPPLLPKTPSESWLWRTLPTVSIQNPVSRLYQSKWQDSKTSSAESKWESIVKSSYLHHDHVRYSEELIPHQQFKS